MSTFEPQPADEHLGWITHTDLSSTDPGATATWAADVLGWQVQEPFDSPAGEYRLFKYAESAGGGIRAVGAMEQPGAVPNVNVADVQASYERALAAGAEGVSEPHRVAPDVVVALVRAPGGVLLGLAGPED